MAFSEMYEEYSVDESKAEYHLPSSLKKRVETKRSTGT